MFGWFEFVCRILCLFILWLLPCQVVLLVQVVLFTSEFCFRFINSVVCSFVF